MKWLAAVFSCLLVFQAVAQELPEMPLVPDPETKILTLPMFIQCGPVAPDGMLEEKYNELGMLEGLGNIFISPSKLLTGKMRMFVNPNDNKSYSIVLQIGEDMHCLVMSGRDLGPMVHGTEL